MTGPGELDDEIRARVAAQLAERAERRKRLREVRRRFDERRRHGLEARKRAKLAATRTSRGDAPEQGA